MKKSESESSSGSSSVRYLVEKIVAETSDSDSSTTDEDANVPCKHADLTRRSLDAVGACTQRDAATPACSTANLQRGDKADLTSTEKRRLIKAESAMRSRNHASSFEADAQFSCKNTGIPSKTTFVGVQNVDTAVPARGGTPRLQSDREFNLLATRTPADTPEKPPAVASDAIDQPYSTPLPPELLQRRKMPADGLDQSARKPRPSEPLRGWNAPNATSRAAGATTEALELSLQPKDAHVTSSKRRVKTHSAKKTSLVLQEQPEAEGRAKCFESEFKRKTIEGTLLLDAAVAAASATASTLASPVKDTCAKRGKERASVSCTPPSPYTLQEQHEFLDMAKRCDFESVRKLIEETPLLVNVQPLGRWSALHHFAAAGNVDAVKFLLNARAACSSKTKDGMTPSEVAKDACRELLEHASRLSIPPPGVDADVWRDMPLELRLELADNFAKEQSKVAYRKNVTAIPKVSKATDVPDGVDVEVWNALPVDVQEDLRKQLDASPVVERESAYSLEGSASTYSVPMGVGVSAWDSITIAERGELQRELAAIPPGVDPEAWLQAGGAACLDGQVPTANDTNKPGVFAGALQWIGKAFRKNSKTKTVHGSSEIRLACKRGAWCPQSRNEEHARIFAHPGDSDFRFGHVAFEGNVHPEFETLRDVFNFYADDSGHMGPTELLRALPGAQSLLSPAGTWPAVKTAWSNAGGERKGIINFAQFEIWAIGLSTTAPATWPGGSQGCQIGLHEITDSVLLGKLQSWLDNSHKKSKNWTRDRGCTKHGVGGCDLSCASANKVEVPKRYKLRRAFHNANRDQTYRYAFTCAGIADECSRGKDPACKDQGELPWSDIGLDRECNEWMLFHGTSEAACRKIASTAFKVELAGTGATWKSMWKSRGIPLYGYGIYFAENITKADEYARPLSSSCAGQKDVCCVLGCRVAVGKVNVVTTDEIDLAQLRADVFRGAHHSVLGDRTATLGKPYKELVVYDKDQVYPEYLLLYERHYRHDRS